MNPIIIFWITFTVLFLIMLYLVIKHGMLNDNSILLTGKPYSFARTQLAWWTLIILSSFITIIIYYPEHNAPQFTSSVILLLSISVGTLATARLVDISDQKNNAVNNIVLSQNQVSQSFILDILSDKDGVSIHRLQTVIFNLIFGCWFMYKVTNNLNTINDINKIMPVIDNNNLVLLGLSAGTYTALKLTENKT